MHYFNKIKLILGIDYHLLLCNILSIGKVLPIKYINNNEIGLSL